MTDNELLGHALAMAKIQTDAFTRDIILSLIDVLNEKKDQITLKDVIEIEVSNCDKYGLDYKTRRPIRNDDKKIMVVRINGSTFQYYVHHTQEFSNNLEDAHDFKTIDFAERMIAEHKLSNVMIIPYFI